MNINFRFNPWVLAYVPAMVYVLIRAAILDFTYDECWTYLGYSSSNVLDVVLNTYPAANNHIFHSLAMKGSAVLFGSSPLALRIPVIVSFVLYCWGVSRISQKLPWFWRLTMISALVYHPYLLDYFVTARGYGLALAGLMWSIFFLREFTEHRQHRALLLGGVTVFLMAWSNFTYLLPAFVWWSIVGMVLIQFNVFKRFAPTVIGFGTLVILAFLYPILQLINANELYYGAETFWEMLTSIGSRFFYRTEGHWLDGVFILSLMIAASLAILHWIRRGFPEWSFGLIAAAMAIDSIVLNAIQHFTSGSPFLTDRTGMFLIPLFLLSTLSMLVTIKGNYMKSVSLLFTLGFIVNALVSMNFTSQLDFKDYADVGKAMEMIDERFSSELPESLVIGKSTYINAPINYYKEYLNMPFVAHSGLDYCDQEPLYEVYYLFAKDLACIEGKPVDTLAYFSVSNTYLMAIKEEGLTRE